MTNMVQTLHGERSGGPLMITTAVRGWLALSIAVTYLALANLAGAAPLTNADRLRFTNNSTGAPTDLHLEYDKNIRIGVGSNPLNFTPEISGTKITYLTSDTKVGVKAGANVIVTTGFKVKGPYTLKKAEWSFPSPKANEAITCCDIETLLGKLDVGGGTTTGVVALRNTSAAEIFFTGFEVVRDIPAFHFDDGDSAMIALNDNNLFFDEGTPVTLDAFTLTPIPSTFSLASGERRIFFLGPVSSVDFIAATFTTDFTSSPSAFAVLVTAASAETIPGLPALGLLGLGALVAIGRKRRRGALLAPSSGRRARGESA
jgi:hypothetical protein